MSIRVRQQHKLNKDYDCVPKAIGAKVFDSSAGVFLDSANSVLVGYEYRQKPDNLSAFKEDAYQDVFIAYLPNKRLAVAAAYADLGNFPGSPAISGGATH